MSIYTDPKAEGNDIAEAAIRLTSAYPLIFSKMNDKDIAAFTSTLKDAVEYVGMTRQQLRDAVMECICHRHQFGQFQISDITDFDRRIKFYDWKTICDKDGFTCIDKDGEVLWVSRSELAALGFKVVDRKIVKA